MLKKLNIKGLSLRLLTALILFAISAGIYSPETYSQNSLSLRAYIASVMYAPLPSNDPYYKYAHYSDLYVADVPAARAVYVTTQNQVVRTGQYEFVTYRRYVRPSDRQEAKQQTWLPSSEPVATVKTSTFVPPNGHLTHTTKSPSNKVIRDFRQTYWLTKYYRDEFHNQASYYKTYGQYNYWNPGTWSAAGDESK